MSLGGRNRKGPVIAIDGPAGVGKTTVSRLLAQRLGLDYIDTGAMYRALAVSATDEGVDINSESELEKFCSRVKMRFDFDSGSIYVNDRDYTKRIREPVAGELASRVSEKEPVRRFLVAMQRGLGERGGVVMEGRDIGTVVFPDADLKIFLDASVGERALRRHRQIERSHGKSIEDTERALVERDRRDTSRAISPLKRAEDAVYIDTTHMTLEEVVDKIVKIFKERLGKAHPGGRVLEQRG